jgi:hypothetical protein
MSIAGHFDFGGVSIECFCHFVCKTDYATFELLEDLGIEQELRGIRRQWGFLSTVGLTLGGIDFLPSERRTRVEASGANPGVRRGVAG